MNFAPDLLSRLGGQARVVVLAGAGLSAGSGVPTFRDAQTGMWSRFRPEDLATAEAFARDAATVWRWYASRRETIRQVAPNPAHHALARWQRQRDVTLITQNVDGLQQRAGGEVIEFHGNIMTDRCFASGRVLGPQEQVDGEPPSCADCGAPVRPGVVWFGEAIPPAALEQAERAAARCDVLLSVGTSSLVYPAAGLAEDALRAGATLVEINPDATPLSTLADFRVPQPAEVALPALVDALGL